jgi:tetratricopeptide (TPR) repeat protein
MLVGVRRWWSLPVVAVTLALAPACGTVANRGSTLYEEGRYVEAAEVFERTEHRLADSTLKERAEYALYRGLTFLELDDTPRARQWLSQAHRMDHDDPGVFDDDERQLLADGWKKLGQGDVTRPPMAPRAAAVARSPAGVTPTVRGSNGSRSLPTTMTR